VLFKTVLLLTLINILYVFPIYDLLERCIAINESVYAMVLKSSVSADLGQASAASNNWGSGLKQQSQFAN
jgi:hypothetical protein